MHEKQKKVPFSFWAWKELEEHATQLGIVWLMTNAMSLVISMGWAKKSPQEASWIFFGLLILGTAVLFIFFCRKWKKISDWNAEDYGRSLLLETILEKFSSTKVSDFSIIEDKIISQWKPFRVEYFLSDSLRAEIKGDIHLEGGGLFHAVLNGTLKGDAKGVTIPQLLDSSYMVFLKNEDRTMRVLVPSPRATKELLVKTLEQWLSSLPQKCHTYQALQNFSISEENISISISHPEIIDYLSGSCELPLANRPGVSAKGIEIQSGVVLATALEVEGKEKIFLPSGFFQKIAIDCASLLEKIKEPKALEAVKVEN